MANFVRKRGSSAVHRLRRLRHRLRGRKRVESHWLLAGLRRRVTRLWPSGRLDAWLCRWRQIVARGLRLTELRRGRVGLRRRLVAQRPSVRRRCRGRRGGRAVRLHARRWRGGGRRLRRCAVRKLRSGVDLRSRCRERYRRRAVRVAPSSLLRFKLRLSDLILWGAIAVPLLRWRRPGRSRHRHPGVYVTALRPLLSLLCLLLCWRSVRRLRRRRRCRRLWTVLLRNRLRRVVRITLKLVILWRLHRRAVRITVLCLTLRCS